MRRGGEPHVREVPNVRVRGVGPVDHPGRRSSAVSYGRTYTLQATRGWPILLALDVWGLASMRKVQVHITVALCGRLILVPSSSFQSEPEQHSFNYIKADQPFNLFDLSNYEQSYLGMVHLQRGCVCVVSGLTLTWVISLPNKKRKESRISTHYVHCTAHLL